MTLLMDVHAMAAYEPAASTAVVRATTEHLNIHVRYSALKDRQDHSRYLRVQAVPECFRREKILDHGKQLTQER